jgi:zinc protease
MKTLLSLLLLLASVASAQIKMPPFERITLDNGAVILLMPKKELPLVSVRVTIKGGTESDPEGLNGIASLTADMLSRGTKTRTRDQISQQFDFLGANIQVDTNRQASFVGTEFLSKDTVKSLALLEDLLKNPTFPEDEFKKALSQRIDAAKSMKDVPQMAINSYYANFFYGAQHPYAPVGTGDEISLSKITRSALESFWKTNYVGRNMIFVASGDFDSTQMTAQLKALASGFAPGTAYTWKKTPATKPATAARLLLIDKPDSTQTYFYIGQPGIQKGNPDRTAIELVNTLFGGRFTSMLNDSLRVDSGLTYGASSRVEDDRLPGSIFITTFTKTESTEAAIDLALLQLDKLSKQGINAEQLASAKAYVKGEYPTRRLETADQLSTVLTDFELYGQNRGEVDDFISRIDSVTVEKANEIARKYYKRDNLVYVLLGNAAKIRATAGKYAKSITEVQITKPGFNASN